jgi:WD40 repeat protein
VGKILVWDLETGSLIRVLEGYEPIVNSLAIAPDGRQALTCDVSGTAELWDLETGHLIRTLERHGGYVNAVAIAPDGRQALTGNRAGTAELWDLNTGQLIRTLARHGGPITSVAIAPNGRQALTGSNDKTARLWDLNTGQSIQTLAGHGGPVRAVAIAPNGGQALTGSDDKTARLWDLNTGQAIQILVGHGGPAYRVAIAPDGTQALTGSGDKTARLWDLKTGQPIRVLRGHPSYVWAVAIAPDGRQALTGGFDNTVRVWDLRTGQTIQTLQGHSRSVQAVAVAPNGRQAWTGSYGGRDVHVWDLETGKLIRALHGHTAGIHKIAITRDSRRALSASEDQTARLWDLETGRSIWTLSGHRKQVTDVVITSDGRYALTGSQDGTARLWDLETGKAIRVLKGGQNSPEAVAITPDGYRALTQGSSRGEALLWDLKNGTLIRSLVGHAYTVRAVAITRDGCRALTGSADGTARLWDLETGRTIHTFRGHTYEVTAVTITSDGRRALTGSSDTTVRLWNLETGQPIRTLVGHGGRVDAVAIAADGRHAFTGSEDSTTRLWDLERGNELCRLITFDDGTWAAVDPHGRYDASNGGDIPGLHWVVGDEPMELVQFRERYFDPGLLAKHLGHINRPPRTVESLSAVRLFPGIKVNPPAAGDNTGTLGITLSDRGGGIGRVVVKINGKEVTDDVRRSSRDTDPRREVARLAIPLARDRRLIPGVRNKIEVHAYNADGTLRSRGALVEYQAGGPAQQPDPELWAVVIGTSDYVGTEIDLRFAAKDAEAFATALRVAAERLLGKGHVQIKVLSTERKPMADRPTKASIESAFKQIAAHARPTDVLVVYLSGHGVAPFGSDEYYYLTADARSLALDDPEVRRRDALSGAELAELIRAVPAVARQVLILDTCAAGRALDVLGQRRAVSGDQVRALERVKDRNGLHLLAGAAADAASYEASRYGQGLLTYSLLLGMTGPGLKGTELDVLTWFGYAVDEVPQLARGIGGLQKPLLSSPRGGASFPVGRLEASDRGQIPLPKARPLLVRSSIVDKETFDDVLGLGGRVDELLRGASARGEGAAPVFVDAREGEGAYRLAGGYRVQGESVSVEVGVLRGRERIGQIPARGSTKDLDALARELVGKLDTLIKP